MPILRAIPLASGSKGNSVFVEGGNARVLVDAGLSCKQIELRLRSVDIEPGAIDAILVTHEHVDHISAVPLFARRYNIPVYTSAGTAACIERLCAPTQTIQNLRTIQAGEELRLGDLLVRPFSISHDAADPLAFRFEVNGAALATATDLGVITRLLVDRLSGCQAVICESNHDPVMLKEGPYPPAVKRRITGKFGHLSNPECRQLVENIYHKDLQTIVLAHLSEQNNTARLAFDETKTFLTRIDAVTELRVAFQDRVGSPIEIG